MNFGNVTGLVTNSNKSQVALIRCDGIDLEDILQDFLATRVNFLMKYVGLPLFVTRLKRIHFQPLEDKVAIKLIPWLGKHVNVAGCSTLVKEVLNSIMIYYITVLEILMEVLMKIDSIRHAYFWVASDKLTKGKCKVN
jgi:hypothetical protein